MKVTREDLGEYARELREFFHHNNVETSECLDEHLWGRFPVEGKNGHFVTVEFRHDGTLGEGDYLVNYLVPRHGKLICGTPIRIRIVPKHNFSSITAGLDSRLDGFNLLYFDERKNLVLQDKVIRSIDIREIKEELSALCTPVQEPYEESYAYLQ